MALIVQHPKLHPDIFDQRSFDSQEKFWDCVKKFFSKNNDEVHAVQFSHFCNRIEAAALEFQGRAEFDTNMLNLHHKPESIMEKILMATRNFNFLSKYIAAHTDLGLDPGFKELINQFGDQMIPLNWVEALVDGLEQALPAANPMRRMCDTQRFQLLIQSKMACFMAPGFFATSQQSNALAIDFNDRRPFANVSIFVSPDKTLGLASNAVPPALSGREVILKKSGNNESFRCSQYTFYVGIEPKKDEEGNVDVQKTTQHLKHYVALPEVYAELLAKQQQQSDDQTAVNPIMYLPYDMSKMVSGHIKGLDFYGSENHKNIHEMMRGVMQHETTRHAEEQCQMASEHYHNVFKEVHVKNVIEKSLQKMAPRSSLFVWDLSTFENVLKRSNNKPTKCVVKVGGVIGDISLNAQNYHVINPEKSKSDGTVFVAATPILSVFYAKNKSSVAPDKVVPTYLCTAMVRLNKIKKGGKGSKGKGKAVEATAEDEVTEPRGGCHFYTFVATCLDTIPQMFEPTFPKSHNESAVIGHALANDITVFHYLDTQTDKCNSYKSILKDDGDYETTEVINKGAIINMMTSLEYVFTSIANGKPHLANCRSIDHVAHMYSLYLKNIEETDEEPYSHLDFLNLYQSILKDNIKDPAGAQSNHYHAIVRSMEMALIPLSEFINQKVLKNKPFERLNALKVKTTPKSLARATAKKAKDNDDQEENDNDESDEQALKKAAALPKGSKRKDAPTACKGNQAKKGRVDGERNMAFRVLYAIGLMRANENASIPSAATLSALTDGKLICEMPLVQWGEEDDVGTLVSSDQVKKVYKKAAPDGKIKKDGTPITAWKSPLHTVALIRAQIPVVDMPVMSFRVRREAPVPLDLETMYDTMVQLMKDAANQLTRLAMKTNITAAFEQSFARSKMYVPKAITFGDVKWTSSHENSLITQQLSAQNCCCIELTEHDLEMIGIPNPNKKKKPVKKNQNPDPALDIEDIPMIDATEDEMRDLERMLGLPVAEVVEEPAAAEKKKAKTSGKRDKKL